MTHSMIDMHSIELSYDAKKNIHRLIRFFQHRKLHLLIIHIHMSDRYIHMSDIIYIYIYYIYMSDA